MRSKIIVFVLCTIINGCASWKQGNSDHTILLGDGFSDSQKQLIKAAVDEWENKTDGVVTFNFSDDWEIKRDVIWIVPSTVQSLSDEYADPGTETLGYTKTRQGDDGASNWIALAVDVTDSELSKNSKHELGHALGLKHVDTPGVIMYYKESGISDFIMCDDIRQFCDIWNCSADELTGCQ